MKAVTVFLDILTSFWIGASLSSVITEANVWSLIGKLMVVSTDRCVHFWNRIMWVLLLSHRSTRALISFILWVFIGKSLVRQWEEILCQNDQWHHKICKFDSIPCVNMSIQAFLWSQAYILVLTKPFRPNSISCDELRKSSSYLENIIQTTLF